MSAALTDSLNPAAELEYNANVVRLFRAPLHAGSLAAVVDAKQGSAGSRAQGASVRVWLQIANERVVTAKFEAYGCPHFIAAAEKLCEWAGNRTLSELKHWNWREVAAYLQLPAGKRARLLVLEDALQRAAGL